MFVHCHKFHCIYRKCHMNKTVLDYLLESYSTCDLRGGTFVRVSVLRFFKLKIGLPTYAASSEVPFPDGYMVSI